MSQEKIGYVYFNSTYVGKLEFLDGDYVFEYDDSYLASSDSISLSLSLPKSMKRHVFQRLHPFFEGLLSEGWMKKIQSGVQKIDEKDSFTRLLNNGEELIGAITVLRNK